MERRRKEEEGNKEDFLREGDFSKPINGKRKKEKGKEMRHNGIVGHLSCHHLSLSLLPSLQSAAITSLHFLPLSLPFFKKLPPACMLKMKNSSCHLPAKLFPYHCEKIMAIPFRGFHSWVLEGMHSMAGGDLTGDGGWRGWPHRMGVAWSGDSGDLAHQTRIPSTYTIKFSFHIITSISPPSFHPPYQKKEKEKSYLLLILSTSPPEGRGRQENPSIQAPSIPSHHSIRQSFSFHLDSLAAWLLTVDSLRAFIIRWRVVLPSPPR